MPERDDDVQLPDIRSPEYRRALRDRGAPHGDHIQEDEEDEVVRPHPDQATATAIAMAEVWQERRAARQAAAAPPPKADWATAPVILSMVVAIISIVGAAAAVLQGYTQLGDRVQSFGERMLTNDGRITVLERQFQERGQKRDGEVASLTSNNALQDSRMQNFAAALEQERQARIESEADIRRSSAETRVQISDLNKALSEIRADLRVLVDRAQRSRSELAQPQRDAQGGRRSGAW